MPSHVGAEHFIHTRIGEIKKRDEPIVIDFELPSGEHKVLTFESYVTRADLKAALRHAANSHVMMTDILQYETCCHVALLLTTRAGLKAVCCGTPHHAALQPAVLRRTVPRFAPHCGSGKTLVFRHSARSTSSMMRKLRV